MTGMTAKLTFVIDAGTERLGFRLSNGRRDHDYFENEPLKDRGGGKNPGRLLAEALSYGGKIVKLSPWCLDLLGVLTLARVDPEGATALGVEVAGGAVVLQTLTRLGSFSTYRTAKPDEKRLKELGKFIRNVFQASPEEVVRVDISHKPWTISLDPKHIEAGCDPAAKEALLARIKGLIASDEPAKSPVAPVSPTPGPEVKARREAYLSHVLRTAGRLSLSGVDPKVAGHESEPLELHAVYTALMTQTSEEIVVGRQRRDPMSRWREAGGHVRLSALELLDRERRLVLLGDPGGGKSTFLNFLAICFAGEATGHPGANLSVLTAPIPGNDGDEENEKSQRWRHGPMLPVRIVLRDFAARGLPPAGQPARAEHIQRFLEQELAAATNAAFAPSLWEELKYPGGLILLDGLDEVPEAEQRRAQIQQAVEEFVASHPRCRFLVTSRTYSYQKQSWRLSGFAEAVLAPFGEEQVNRFVDRWYAHIGVLRGLGAGDAQGRAELLKQVLRGNDRLMALAERPLLLTLMASLHAWRGGTLPEQREQLYAEAVDLLLERWEGPKVVQGPDGKAVIVQPSLAQWLQVDRKRVRIFLNELAFDAHASQPELTGAADIPGDRVVGGLFRINQSPDVNPARLVEYLSDRAGLLLPRGNNVYAFPHRTFQEYLAACHLTDCDYPEELADRVKADPERWREAALLAAAKAAEGASASLWLLVDALCDGEPDSAKGAQDLWAAQIAGLAVAERGELGKVTPRAKPRIERVGRWLVQAMRSTRLPPVERARAGDALGKIGDPRFLPREQGCLPIGQDLGFLEIPMGTFLMGSDKKRDPAAYPDEMPQHEQRDFPLFYMARYPVTVDQFRAFVEDSKHPIGDPNCLRGRPNHPVVRVSWSEAWAYADWLTEKLVAWTGTPVWMSRLLAGEGEDGRRWRVVLPSEAEWEKAARGTDGRIYPWKDEADPNKANYDKAGIGGTSAVGCFAAGASAYGCEEMSGNVWEWTRSLWPNKVDGSEGYPYDAGDGREVRRASSSLHRVVRGGSFVDLDRPVRCAIRLHTLDVRSGHIGFRVAVSPYTSVL
jgi:formylglycine-generating enzyme required for sulfatase activity